MKTNFPEDELPETEGLTELDDASIEVACQAVRPLGRLIADNYVEAMRRIEDQPSYDLQLAAFEQFLHELSRCIHLSDELLVYLENQIKWLKKN